MNQPAFSDNQAPLQSPFVGGGQMGERIRKLDWSATPLGPVSNWPQSLKTAINIMLASQFPMMIHWGKELIHFYNDGYATILQEKHPGALGAPAQPWWDEMWDFLTPIFNRVLAGETTFFENSLVLPHRRGFLEECYFTFSHSPLYNENGQIGGIFVTALETTESVINQRRLALLSELASRTNQAVSTEEVTSLILEAFGTNSYDIPFAMFYRQEQQQIFLSGQIGFSNQATTASSNPTSQVVAECNEWLYEQINSTNEPKLLTTLPEQFGTLSGGPWPQPAREAFLLPLHRPQADAQSHYSPYGYLLLGISPRRLFDEHYRSFFTLIGKHVVSALNSVTAYEHERQRVIALSELDEAKNVFFSNITHELRTPLTLMLGPVNDLLHGSLPKASRELLLLAERNGRRLQQLVNSLLDFSRLQAGRLQPQFQPVELSSLTENIAETFRPAIERAGLDFVVTCESLPQVVYVDPQLWERILFNLLSNALNFTFEGEIKVLLQPTTAGASLHIQDTGTGIDEEHIKGLFTRFYRIEGARARVPEGSGIGLAMVAQLVKLHGGEVLVHSVLGKGSEFIISIPYENASILDKPPIRQPANKDQIKSKQSLISSSALADAYSSLKLQEDNNSRFDSYSKETPSILLVEDNADMRGYLKSLLQEHYQLLLAQDGKQALQIIDNSKVDLVISDVMMPYLNGIKLVEIIRSQPSTQSLPVLLLSARTGEQARIAGIRSGADEYLEKPFHTQELLTRVEMMLDLAKKRKFLFNQLQQAYAESEQARRELVDQQQHLSEANQRLDGFVHVVAHDLKGPVSNAKQLMEWISNGREANQKDHLLGLLGVTISRLDSILQGLFSIIELGSGKEIAAVSVSFAQVLQLLEWELQDTLRETKGRVQADFSALDTIIYAEAYLISILRNLVNNALKYRSPDRTPLIKIQTKRVDEFVLIRIEDNGLGIDLQKYGNSLFEPFKRLTTQGEGSGLGLHLVKTMVEHNGGLIQVKSEPGIGTSFTLYLKEYEDNK